MKIPLSQKNENENETKKLKNHKTYGNDSKYYSKTSFKLHFNIKKQKYFQVCGNF